MITSWPIGVTWAPYLGPGETGGGAVGVDGLVGRELRDYAEFRAAHELYTRVFGYEDPSFALNPNLLCALTDNGGSAVGVFTPDDRIVGFAYGFAGRDAAGRDYHYSQSAVVDAEFQGFGIGRELKRLQRIVAERWGHASMRWTFDPILTRNGHFNFSTLGAIGTDYLTDYYGRPCTDRLVVEWSFAGADPYGEARALPAPMLVEDDWAVPFEHGDGVWIPLPVDPSRAADAGLRAPLADALRAELAAGRVLIDCRRLSETTAAYLAVPRIAEAEDARADAPHQEES